MTLASKITLVRVAFIPAYMALMYASNGQSGLWMWLAFAVFVIASLTDYIDGEIARRHNQVSDLGKFLDPLADKLLVISAMVILLIGLLADNSIKDSARISFDVFRFIMVLSALYCGSAIICFAAPIKLLFSLSAGSFDSGLSILWHHSSRPSSGRYLQLVPCHPAPQNPSST